MKKEYKSEFITLLAASEKAPKKGNSLAAVSKLVEELAEFEENIQEAVDAQEMTQNKQAISEFLSHFDNMYDVLLKMLRSTLIEVRNRRNQTVDVIEESPNSDITNDIPESEVEQPIEEDVFHDSLKKSMSNVPTVSSLKAPKVPKM